MDKEAKLKLNSEEWLRTQYITLDKSIKEISKELGVYKATIVSRLRKYHIEKDPQIINKKRYKSLQRSMVLKYGEDHPSKVKEIQAKKEKTNLTKYGVKSTLSFIDTQKKIKKTNIERYGYENPQKNVKIQERTKKTNLKKYGNECCLLNKSVKEKTKQTLIERYGVDNVSKSKDIKNKKITTCTKNYGVKHPAQSKKIQDIFKKTMLKRYGVENPTQSKKIQERINQTKKNNGTYGTSKAEDNLYLLLESLHPQISSKYVERQYSEDIRYPFACDYYIAEDDCFIELQGYWSHGKEPFNGDNAPLSWKNKSEKSDHYKNALRVYTQKDPLKRIFASQYCLNYLEIWNSDILKGWDWVEFLLVKQGLPLYFPENVLKRELENISKQKGDFSRNPNQNKIIKKFQSHIYRKERELWNNPKIREKLVTNREKYLFKNKIEITNQQFLQGFKISGIHVGFSFFSPLWIKAFIEKYHVKSIYDPCMGWGHRLLGAKDITYIGNDTCLETYQGNLNISKYFKMKNKIFYNNPAEEFIPEHNYDAIFTCPPYFNTEKYNGENTSTEKYPDYESWLKGWWRKVIQNSLIRNPKYFAFVINNRYKEDMKSICIQEGLTILEEIPVGKNSLNHFQRLVNTSLKGEFLLIFKYR